MYQTEFNELAGWVTKAALIGRSESDLMSGFCRRIVNAGGPLARAIVILDTLHPIYEAGRSGGAPICGTRTIRRPSKVVVSAVHGHGGDVLKLIGDGTLAIFPAVIAKKLALERSPRQHECATASLS